MSIVFTDVQYEPEYTPLTHLLENVDPEIKEKFEALRTGVQENYRHLFVPKDIWALILRQAIPTLSKPDPDKWGEQFTQWFYYWSFTPELRKVNPISVFDDYHQALRGFSYNISNTGFINLVDEDWLENHGIRNKTCWQPYDNKEYSTVINRMGDLFNGFIIDNSTVKLIEKIEFEIGGQRIPMIIDLNSPNQLNTRGGVVDWYQAKYMPFIPLIALQYHIVRVYVKFKEDVSEELIKEICTKEIKGFWSLLNSYWRRKVAIVAHEFMPIHDVPIVESPWVPGKKIPDPDKFKYGYILRVMSGMGGMAFTGCKEDGTIDFHREEAKKYFWHPELKPKPRPLTEEERNILVPRGVK